MRSWRSGRRIGRNLKGTRERLCLFLNHIGILVTLDKHKRKTYMSYMPMWFKKRKAKPFSIKINAFCPLHSLRNKLFIPRKVLSEIFFP